MNSLLPDQVRVLSEVLQSDEIVIAARLQLTRDEVKTWIDRCESLIKASTGTLLGKHYTLSLDKSAKGSKKCAVSHLLAATSTQPSVVSLDLRGNVVATGPGLPTLSAALARTKQGSSLELLIHGTYIYVVLAGDLIGERDVSDQTKLPPAGISYYRPTRQMRQLIRDHAGQEIARETGLKFWADKQKRVLVAKPENTEKIFQRSLLTWLRHYVVDKLRIYSETRGFGQDATDITVMTGYGDYVVEVKWMGENENGTTYDGTQILVGIKQIGKYLDNDERLVSGTVVVYDARPASDAAVDMPNRNCMHVRCEAPEVVWLESETPSQLAVSEAKSTSKQLGTVGKPLRKRKAKR
jgi:hypothetical protein